jgi:hypothetical protein
MSFNFFSSMSLCKENIVSTSYASTKFVSTQKLRRGNLKILYTKSA